MVNSWHSAAFWLFTLFISFFFFISLAIGFPSYFLFSIQDESWAAEEDRRDEKGGDQAAGYTHQVKTGAFWRWGLILICGDGLQVFLHHTRSRSLVLIALRYKYIWPTFTFILIFYLYFILSIPLFAEPVGRISRGAEEVNRQAGEGQRQAWGQEDHHGCDQGHC